MEILVISSEENLPIAEKLLADFPWATPLQGFEVLQDSKRIEHLVKQELLYFDCIMPIIDSSFADNNCLMTELRVALEESKKHKKIIFPILIKNAKAPESLKNVYCVRVEDPDNPNSYARAQRKIQNFEANRYLKTNIISSFMSRYGILYILALVTVALGIFLLGLYFQERYYGEYLQNRKQVFFIFGIGLIVSSFVYMFVFLVKYQNYRRQRSTRDEYIYSKQLEKKIVSESKPITSKDSKEDDAPKKEEINALGLMQVNLSNIEKYYKWSQKQAKSAFTLAVIMCIVGLVVFSLAVLLPTVFRVSIEVAVITAIAGGLVEVFAGTALVVYKSSVAQLNYYHKALHEDERFLSSVNLIGEFSTAEKKDEVLHEIIKSEISMNTMPYDNTAPDTKQRKN